MTQPSENPQPFAGRLCRLLAAPFRRFVRSEEGGSLSLELVLFGGLMAFTSMMIFAYWEAFRVRANSGNATYVISDMISREGAPVDEDYITGMSRVYAYMTMPGPDAAFIRVTSLDFHQGTNRYRVLWSRSTDEVRAPELTNADLAAMRDVSIPTLEDGASLLLIESWRDFFPAFRVGLDAQTFYTRLFMLPRFISPLPIR